MSKEQRGIWRQHGDMLLVDYEGERFRAEQVADTVVGFINGYGARYKRVVFIGSSMGGLLAADCFERLSPLIRTQVSIVLLDAPTTAADFQAPLDKAAPLMRVLPFGPISNLLSGPIMNALMVPPQGQNIAPEADRKELARRFKQMTGYPLSFYRDQVHYIISHGKLAFASLRSLEQMVYVRSTRDHDTVRERAYGAWWVAYGQKPVRIEVDSAHVAYLEQPNNWDKAFQEIIKVLGV